MESATGLKTKNWPAAAHAAAGAAVFAAVYFTLAQSKLAIAGLVAASAGVALLTNPRLCTYVLTLTLPFVSVCVIKSLTGKDIGVGVQPVYLLTAMLALSVYLRHCVTGKPLSLPRGPMPAAIAGLFAVWVVSIIPVLLNPPYGFGAQHIAKYLSILAVTAVCFGTYFVYCAALRGRDDVFRQFVAMVVITDFAAFYGFYRLACYFNDGLRKLDFMRMFLDTNVSQTSIDAVMRLRAVSFEAGAFGDFLLVTLPGIMCFVMEGRGISKRMRVFMCGSFALVLGAFVMTGARGASAGLVVSTAIVLAMNMLVRRGGWTRAANLAAALVAIALCIAAVLYSAGVSFNAVSEFTKNTISGRFEAGYVASDISLKSRLSAYEMAALEFGESPVTGLGFTVGGFYSYPDLRFGKSWGLGGWQPERNLLTFAIGESGILGLLAFLFFIACFVREGLLASDATRGDPAAHSLAVGLFAGFAGILVSRVFAIGFGLSYMWFPLALLAVLRASSTRDSRGPVS